MKDEKFNSRLGAVLRAEACALFLSFRWMDPMENPYPVRLSWGSSRPSSAPLLHL